MRIVLPLRAPSKAVGVISEGAKRRWRPMTSSGLAWIERCKARWGHWAPPCSGAPTPTIGCIRADYGPERGAASMIALAEWKNPQQLFPRSVPNRGRSISVLCVLPKHERRVRLPPPAPVLSPRPEIRGHHAAGGRAIQCLNTNTAPDIPQKVFALSRRTARPTSARPSISAVEPASGTWLPVTRKLKSLPIWKGRFGKPADKI